jgi:Ca2+-binding RTX toxin-like protein
MPLINITALNENPHETVAGIRADTGTRGVDLDGALITATYTDGTVESITWQALDPYTFGGATGANIDMLFGYSTHELTVTRRLKSFEIDLQPADSVFDITLDFDGDLSTPGSNNGYPFEFRSESASITGDVTVTYSGVVNVVGNDAVGDLYTTIRVDFSAFADGGLLGALEWSSDIDTMRDAGDLFPVSTDGLIVIGTSGVDDLVGSDGNDRIFGLGQNDILEGGSGDDVLDGGFGIDTAIFDAPQSSFTLTLSAGQTTISDRREGGLGTDELISIEFLDFEPEIELYYGPMNFDAIGSGAGLQADELTAIVELYIAYFNRAPDAIGLNYWASEFTKGFTLPEMALTFFVQDETRATYASVLDSEFKLDVTDTSKIGDFVTQVYDNVLGRGPDTPGFNYWLNELEKNPEISPGIFILAILNGAKFPSEPTDLTAIDQVYLSNKVELGAYFSVIRGMSDVDDAISALALFDGSQTSIDETIAAIDGHYVDALDAQTGDFLMPLVGIIDDPFLI